MKYIIGKLVTIHFKDDELTMSGILAEIESEHVYIQIEKDIFVIPQKDIRFYQTSELVAESVQETQPQAPQETAIRVCVNGEFLVNIQVPPTMNLLSATEEVLRTVWANPEVQNALRGKVQKTLEYSPGEVNIILVDQESEARQEEVSFALGGTGNPLNTYLSPSDMVSRLKNITKRGEKNE